MIFCVFPERHLNSGKNFMALIVMAADGLFVSGLGLLGPSHVDLFCT